MTTTTMRLISVRTGRVRKQWSPAMREQVRRWMLTLSLAEMAELAAMIDGAAGAAICRDWLMDHRGEPGYLRFLCVRDF